MPRNLELKARLSNYAAARTVACRVATRVLEPQRQIDTYFRGAAGRLKLRQINGAGGHLIWYQRADTIAFKPSDYVLAAVDHADVLGEALAGAYGVDLVVTKQREIFLHHQVRIHLDRVEGLGEFLELEAVLGDECDPRRAEQLMSWLVQQFGIEPAARIACSYSDLLRGGEW